MQSLKTKINRYFVFHKCEARRNLFLNKTKTKKNNNSGYRSQIAVGAPTGSDPHPTRHIKRHLISGNSHTERNETEYIISSINRSDLNNEYTGEGSNELRKYLKGTALLNLLPP